MIKPRKERLANQLTRGKKVKIPEVAAVLRQAFGQQQTQRGAACS